MDHSKCLLEKFYMTDDFGPNCAKDTRFSSGAKEVLEKKKKT